MKVLRKSLLTTMLCLFGLTFTVLGNSPESDQVLNRSRELVANGSMDEAIALIEAEMENLPEGDYPALLDQLRKFYLAAINENRKAGRYELADQYSHNLKIIDAATVLHVAQEEANPSPAAPYQELPKIRDRDQLQQPVPVRQLPQSVKRVPAEPAVTIPSVRNPIAKQTPTKIQEFDLAEADDAFQNQKFQEAGAIYLKLYESGRLPESRRSQLAYCKCAEVVSRINSNPSDGDSWTKIHADIELVQKIQPDFWYAEYLKDLVKERSNKVLGAAAQNNPATTQLASNSGSGVISRAATQIRSIALNPLRRTESAR